MKKVFAIILIIFIFTNCVYLAVSDANAFASNGNYKMALERLKKYINTEKGAENYIKISNEAYSDLNERINRNQGAVNDEHMRDLMRLVSIYNSYYSLNYLQKKNIEKFVYFNENDYNEVRRELANTAYKYAIKMNTNNYTDILQKYGVIKIANNNNIDNNVNIIKEFNKVKNMAKGRIYIDIINGNESQFISNIIRNSLNNEFRNNELFSLSDKENSNLLIRIRITNFKYIEPFTEYKKFKESYMDTIDVRKKENVVKVVEKNNSYSNNIVATSSTEVKYVKEPIKVDYYRVENTKKTRMQYDLYYSIIDTKGNIIATDNKTIGYEDIVKWKTYYSYNKAMEFADNFPKDEEEKNTMSKQELTRNVVSSGMDVLNRGINNLKKLSTYSEGF